MTKEATPWTKIQAMYWNGVSHYYDELYSSTWSALEDAQLLKKLSAVTSLETAKTILDLGCGTGLGLEICQKLISTPFEYVGIDISPEMISICRHKWPNRSFFVADMSNLTLLPSNSFDTVICLFTSFSFTDQPKNCLSEVHRVIKSGGEAFISVLSKYSLRRMMRAKLDTLEMYSTRYSPAVNTVPAMVYSKSEIQKLFQQTGFSINGIYGQGFFSGVFEHPIVWPLDVLLSSVATDLCHLINIHITKKENKLHGFSKYL